MSFRRVTLTVALVASAASVGIAGPAVASVSIRPISYFSYADTVAIRDGCDVVWVYNPGQGTWTNTGFTTYSVYIGAPGVFATDTDSGDIEQYQGTPGAWTVIGGPGAAFAIGGSSLYGLGPSDNYVAVWNGPGEGWTEIGGPASAIAAGGAGLVATNPADTGLFLYNGPGEGWTEIGGSGITTGTTFTVGDSGIYGVTSSGLVEQWTGSGQSWTVIGSGVRSLTAGGAGVFGVSSATGDIEQYQGTPGAWTVIGGPGTAFAANATDLYGTAPDETYVAQYTPGTGWNEISTGSFYLATALAANG